MKLSPTRTKSLLRRMDGARVLVLGDVMLDVFLWGQAVRLSPEAPVPVVEITRESDHLGGAANVAANVRALGGGAVVLGVSADDGPGATLRQALAMAGIDDARVPGEDDRPTTVKTRIVAHHQQVVRADRESAAPLHRSVEKALVARLAEILPSVQIVVVSDYHKGVVTAGLMRALVRACRRGGIAVLVDPKVRQFPLYRGVTLVTPNQPEAEQATGVRIRDDASLRRAGERILTMLRCDAVLVTRGEHGMALFTRGAEPLQIPTAAREVYDVTGAGDTVIATVALALAAGARLPEAALLANIAAGVVVGRLGTATASPADVLEAMEASS